jgi:uncharacterized protein YbbC (DUF1343 family)
MKLGIDIFQNNPEAILKKRNFALITGSSTVDSSGNPTYRLVKQLAGKQMKAIWSLQHGFFMDKQDNMIFSDSFFWEELDCEVKSLYRDKIFPESDWLKNLDALVIDLQDVGTRVYTFLNHMVLVMKYLSGSHIDVIVLDRPNPLNGVDIEGNVAEENYFSIVGSLPVPMRHGLSAGEFLAYALSIFDIELNLEIVKITNWKRKDHFKGVWTYPSPNMPSLQTAMVYPGAVLLEGTNISEGRGTTRPFEFLGSPFIDNTCLINELKKCNLKAVQFVPIFFKPEYSKFSNTICQGILVVAENIKEFNVFQIFYEVIRLIRNLYPDKFNWKQPPYEYETERLPIDMICGTDFIRKSIEMGMSYDEISLSITSQINDYKKAVANYLLY